MRQSHRNACKEKGIQVTAFCDNEIRKTKKVLGFRVIFIQIYQTILLNL